MNKENRGITLVALVITVIVMLILAGVSISVLTADGGLFKNVADAAEKYKDASKRENDEIEHFINEMDAIIEGQWNGTGNVKELIKSGKIKVGDYINYDAGAWTQGDLDKITASSEEVDITVHSTVNDTTDNNVAQPTVNHQFGGFEINKSKNDNAIPIKGGYPAKMSGWRVWDVDENTGEITIITAGCPENYYNAGDTSAAVNVLRSRNCSMYENKFAKTGKAHILTGEEAKDWYNKMFDTEYTLTNNGENNSTFCYWATNGLKKFTDSYPIDVLNNGGYFWFATASSSSNMYGVDPSYPCVGYYFPKVMGLRVLVTLKSNISLEEDTNKDNTWKLVEN